MKKFHLLQFVSLQAKALIEKETQIQAQIRAQIRWREESRERSNSWVEWESRMHSSEFSIVFMF